MLIVDALESGQLRIAGARYDLDDGRVEFYEQSFRRNCASGARIPADPRPARCAVPPC